MGGKALRTKLKLNKSHIQGGIAMLPISALVLSALVITSGRSEAETNDSNTLAGQPAIELTAKQKDATEFTAELNRAVYAQLDFENTQEYEFATRGLLAAPEQLEIRNADGAVIWSQKAFEFVRDTEAPDTANPSLWRNTQLNHSYGLFKVADGIYQVRGYDISNLTLIEGDTGWIILDPLTNKETAQAALKLANDTLGARPVVGIIYSHTHADHFGGVRGVIDEEQIAAGNVPIIAPDGFEKYAVSENLYVGNAMQRRSVYQFGRTLDAGPWSRLGVGLGVGTPEGTTTYIPPNLIITHTGQIVEVDGVKMEFQLTPGTEAPAEMNTWFPDMKALWLAENCNATMHNLYTLRGAQVRDGNAWAMYIMEALSRYGTAEVAFMSHNWPRWGNDVIAEYLTNSAAMYKFINDQTLLFVNQGYTPNEIARMIQLPADLAQVWYTRPYYGTLEHNAKAVYQKYMGWYDANPVNLHPLTPTDSAKKFVEYLGDPDKVLEMALQDFAKGEYQWVAEVTRILIYADPTNRPARYLCADALEQLGYQAESGVWRSAYLTGAKELREGITPLITKSAGDMLRSLTPVMVFDYLGIRIDSVKAQDVNLKINVNVLGDTSYLLTMKSGVLLYQKDQSADDADVIITIPRPAVALLASPDVLSNDNVRIEGNREAFAKLYGFMAEFDPNFNIIEPK